MASATLLSTNAPQLIEYLNIPVTFTPYDAKWIPGTARFVAMGQLPKGNGVVNVYALARKSGASSVPATTTTTATTSARSGADAPAPPLAPASSLDRPSGVKCGTFGASAAGAAHLATGDLGGALHIIDVGRPDAKPVFAAAGAHPGGVNAIDGCGGAAGGGGAPEIATCGRDGAVRVWDPRVPTAVVALEPAQGDVPRDCWAVAFGNSVGAERCVVAGYDNGDIKMFDLCAGRMRWQHNVGNGVVGLEFDRKDVAMNKLVATTLESRFRVYDVRTQHPVSGFASVTERAHKATVWAARHAPGNRDVWVTVGGNGGVNLYRYHYPAARSTVDPADAAAAAAAGGGAAAPPRGVAGTVELLNAKIVSPQPVVSWDWCAGKEGLAVGACLDNTLRVFIVTRLERLA